MPAAPPVSPNPAPTRPKQVDTSFTLWVVSSTLSLVAFVVVLLLYRDETVEVARAGLQGGDQPLSDANVEAAVTATFVFTGVVAALFFGLYLLFAFKMRAGRGWARIVLAVLGGLGVMSSLYNLVGGNTGVLTLVLDVAQIAIVGTAIYLMFTREATDYFELAKRAG